MNHCTPTVGIYTLGCKVNQYESEAIAEEFVRRGFSVQPPTEPCDVYVINTCTVTAESDRKARQFIRRAIQCNCEARVLVTGCYAQIDPDCIAEIEGVDYVCGNAGKLSVVDEACRLLQLPQKPSVATVERAAPDAHGFEPMQIDHFNRTRAYVKIEDGCESRCTYCIIPDARGSIRSKCPSDVLREVTALTENGCREIVLTGIETASYGKDLDGYGLADLLEEIDRIPGIGRIRLGSLDPSLIKPAFVERIAKLHSLAPHFHLSMQSGSDRILAQMKRKYNRRMAELAIERLRAAFPTARFTTDIIVGFPGETGQDFLDTVELVRTARFLNVHVFPYSKRAGTPAAEMRYQIPDKIKRLRVAELLRVVSEVRDSILEESLGKVEEVLFETYENGIATGHTANFTEVYCYASEPLQARTIPVLLTVHDGERCRGSLYIPNRKE